METFAVTYKSKSWWSWLSDQQTNIFALNLHKKFAIIIEHDVYSQSFKSDVSTQIIFRTSMPGRSALSNSGRGHRRSRSRASSCSRTRSTGQPGSQRSSIGPWYEKKFSFKVLSRAKMNIFSSLLLPRLQVLLTYYWLRIGKMKIDIFKLPKNEALFRSKKILVHWGSYWSVRVMTLTWPVFFCKLLLNGA